jgi:hypothetical protein
MLFVRDKKKLKLRIRRLAETNRAKGELDEAKSHDDGAKSVTKNLPLLSVLWLGVLLNYGQ